MRKILFLPSFIIFFLLTENKISFAQENIAVFFVKGGGTFGLPNKTTQSLCNNIQIQLGASLKLNPQTELTLRDKKGRFCILNTHSKEQIFTYKQVLKAFDEQENKGLLEAVYDFMKSQISKDKKDIRDYADYNLKKKGGVTRSSCTIPLMINPGFDAKVNATQQTFYWHNDNLANSYHFVIYSGDMFEQNAPVLYKTSVKDTLLTLSLSEIIPNIAYNEPLSWVVWPTLEPENCSRYSFFAYTQENIDTLVATILQEAKKIESEQEQYLFLANSFEQEGFLDHAHTYIQKLNETYPIKLHKDLYLIFLARNGML